MRRTSGFTLLEIMIVVAIIGILSAIAVPQYSKYVTRAKIIEATSGLSDMAVQMERWFQDNRTYATATDANGPCNSASLATMNSKIKNFAIECNPAPAATTYTVTATGIASMVGFVYSIDQTNTRRTVSVEASWTNLGSACWVTKPDGSC